VAEIVLLRHAETEWSKAGKHTGRTDIPLTDAGREHARKAAERLAGRTFSLVLSSPLVRATETAGIVGLQPELDDDLMEWDYGAYEGRTTKEIRVDRPDWDMWTQGVPEGEVPEDVAARADRVIARAVAADGDVCLVAHGHLLRVLAARWLDMPAAAGAHFALATATTSLLGWERGQPVIERWNEACAP
jgi:probable phosphoglycerate mutase